MLNQILEQAKADMFDVINEGTPTDVRNLLEAQLTTAFTAGVKKGVEDEKERVREIINKLDYSTTDDFIYTHDPMEHKKVDLIVKEDLLSELNKQEK
jgi:hypothetical protein